MFVLNTFSKIIPAPPPPSKKSYPISSPLRENYMNPTHPCPSRYPFSLRVSMLAFSIRLELYSLPKIYKFFSTFSKTLPCNSREYAKRSFNFK